MTDLRAIQSPGTWQELGPGIFVRHEPHLAMNSGLVVGDERALVIDTGYSSARGADLLAAVQQVTDLDPVVVNTHAHVDHCFGNAAFRDAQIYAHAGAADDLFRTGAQQRTAMAAMIREAGHGDSAQEIEETEIVAPFYLIDQPAPLDLGGRTVGLYPVGEAHTDHDLIVTVPDAGVVFWGDLIEIGADPAMEDAFPLRWGPVLRRLLRTDPIGRATVHVPGHGAVVGPGVVADQAELLVLLAERLGQELQHGAIDAADLARAAQGLELSAGTVATAAQRALYLHSQGSSANH